MVLSPGGTGGDAWTCRLVGEAVLPPEPAGARPSGGSGGSTSALPADGARCQGPERGRAEPSRAGPGRAEPRRAEPGTESGAARGCPGAWARHSAVGVTTSPQGPERSRADTEPKPWSPGQVGPARPPAGGAVSPGRVATGRRAPVPRVVPGRSTGGWTVPSPGGGPERSGTGPMAARNPGLPGRVAPAPFAGRWGRRSGVRSGARHSPGLAPLTAGRGRGGGGGVDAVPTVLGRPLAAAFMTAPAWSSSGARRTEIRSRCPRWRSRTSASQWDSVPLPWCRRREVRAVAPGPAGLQGRLRCLRSLAGRGVPAARARRPASHRRTALWLPGSGAGPSAGPGRTGTSPGLRGGRPGAWAGPSVVASVPSTRGPERRGTWPVGGPDPGFPGRLAPRPRPACGEVPLAAGRLGPGTVPVGPAALRARGCPSAWADRRSGRVVPRRRPATALPGLGIASREPPSNAHQPSPSPSPRLAGDGRGWRVPPGGGPVRSEFRSRACRKDGIWGRGKKIKSRGRPDDPRSSVTGGDGVFLNGGRRGPPAREAAERLGSGTPSATVLSRCDGAELDRGICADTLCPGGSPTGRIGTVELSSGCVWVVFGGSS